LGKVFDEQSNPATMPHPLSPAGRLFVASGPLQAPLVEDFGKPEKKDKDSDNKAQSGPKAAPPPRTKRGTITVQSGDKTVEVETLPDGKDKDLGDHAATQPSYTISSSGKVKFTVQTKYGPEVKATDNSAYGRGTTDDDKKNGNTSVGFHESCHRENYLEYIKAHPVPDTDDELKTYLENMHEDTESKTDEVGDKKSEQDKPKDDSGTRKEPPEPVLRKKKEEVEIKLP
jgi:hypothetical protein